MKIGVFCSANQQIDAEYFELTRQLGAWMAAQGHTLVFGGCDMGLMECVARAVKEGGGYTIGIVPTLIERGGHVSDYVDTKILCDNLSDRKDLLLAQSDILVALPGSTVPKRSSSRPPIQNHYKGLADVSHSSAPRDTRAAPRSLSKSVPGD